mmetsp:Transcript_9243/g.23105  ORF Transcript_9243/g.23105 Transcript_9243/m.23105 type:complete len:106 (-) Transcript_9243:260-577(-)
MNHHIASYLSLIFHSKSPPALRETIRAQHEIFSRKEPHRCIILKQKSPLLLTLLEGRRGGRTQRWRCDASKGYHETSGHALRAWDEGSGRGRNFVVEDHLHFKHP